MTNAIRRDLSVIIPVLSEGTEPIPLIQSIRHQPVVCETLVVEAEGDPGPRTEIDRSWASVQRLTAPRGRASQMNAGARAARGRFLLFLHADSRIAPDALEEVVRVLERPGPKAVAFRLAFREREAGLRWLETVGRVLSAISPYALGDQGLGLRRMDFLAMGGFPDVPILEDWILIRSIRKNGGLRILPSICQTSGRRFLRRGIFRQLMENGRILYDFGDGKTLDVLSRRYERAGSKREAVT